MKKFNLVLILALLTLTFCSESKRIEKKEKIKVGFKKKVTNKNEKKFCPQNLKSY